MAKLLCIRASFRFSIRDGIGIPINRPIKLVELDLDLMKSGRSTHLYRSAAIVLVQYVKVVSVCAVKIQTI